MVDNRKKDASNGPSSLQEILWWLIIPWIAGKALDALSRPLTRMLVAYLREWFSGIPFRFYKMELGFDPRDTESIRARAGSMIQAPLFFETPKWKLFVAKSSWHVVTSTGKIIRRSRTRFGPMNDYCGD